MINQKIKEPYVESLRSDALGCRMLSIISAFWIAKKLNYNFYFNWVHYDEYANYGDEYSNLLSTTKIKINDIFQQEFIDRHHIEKEHFYGYTFPYKIFIDDLKQYKTINYSQNTFPFLLIDGIQKDKCLQELRAIYCNEILWSKKYQNIIDELNDLTYKKQFIAIHIRGKDVVCNPHSNQLPERYMRSLYFPYEVALDIAIEEIGKGNFILLFGQDVNDNIKFRDIVKDITAKDQIEVADLYIKHNYIGPEKDFFDLNLMSKASRIYATGDSGFSNLAQLISGRETLVTIYQKYDKKQLCDIILKNINKVSIDNLYRCYSLYMLYAYLREMNKPLQECIKFIKEAIEIQPTNIGYQIALNDYLLHIGDIGKVEQYLSGLIFDSKYQEFEDLFYGCHIAPWVYGFYDKFYTKIIDVAKNTKLPYLSYVASKILRHIYKDNTRAYEILKLATEQNKEILQLRIEIMEENQITISENFNNIQKENTELKMELDTKTKENMQINTLTNQLNTLTTEINSYPIKKQSLEISNLEQDLINKKLKAQILEKELGLDNEINLKYNNALQENENLKAQLSKLNQEFETNNPKSKSENQRLQKINTDLYFALNYGTAKSRIKNQLSYKLGEAMIANSKSLWGYIKMPYILSYIKETHQTNQKLYQEKIKANPSLKLPPLETYPDYNEAIKIKEHLSYKLGEALIDADKSKLKLGYLTLWFKCKNITKEHKNNHKDSPNNPNH